MTGWQLTLGLQNLRAQVDTAFPTRDKTSDGTIGDQAHQAETSGHNADDTPGSKPAWDGDPDTLPEARAWDMDSDLRFPGVTAQQLVDHIRRLPGVADVLRYMIYNRTMYHSRDGFNPSPYTGSSPHTEHVHFEGAWTQAADDNRTFDYRLEDLVMTPADVVNEFAAQLGDPNSALAKRMRAVPWQYTGGGIPTGMSTLSVLAGAYAQAAAAASLAGRDDVDEQAVAAAVLAVLTPEKIAAAIPADMARRVADELGARISRPRA